MANLLEAGKLKVDPSGKRFSVVVIEGDRQGSSAFYPKEVLEAAESKFAAKSRIYMNHPTEMESWDRPERDAEKLVGYIENGKFDGKDIIAEAVIFSDWQGWVKERAEAGVIALSIRASGVVDESGTLSAFTKIHSVDLVTEAGAGGAFKQVLESNRNKQPEGEGESKMDEALKKALDELVESGKQTAIAVAKLVEADAKREQEAADALAEAERKEKEAEESGKPTATEIAAALVESELAKPAQDRVLKAVEEGAVLAEAIKVEKEYAEAILSESRTNAGAGFVADEGGAKKVSLSETVFARSK